MDNTWLRRRKILSDGRFIGTPNWLFSIVAKRWRWERFTSQMSIDPVDILLHKVLSAPSFGCCWKQAIRSAYWPILRNEPKRTLWHSMHWNMYHFLIYNCAYRIKDAFLRFIQSGQYGDPMGHTVILLKIVQTVLHINFWTSLSASYSNLGHNLLRLLYFTPAMNFRINYNILSTLWIWNITVIHGDW